MKKKILYIARGGLPINALGMRIYQIGKLLNNMGYEIHYICNSSCPCGIENKYRILQNTGNLLNKEEIHFYFEDNLYSYLPVTHKNVVNSLMRMVEIITAKKEFERVAYYAAIERPEAIILYNDAYGLTKRLIPYCRERGIKLIGDITEWYDKRGQKTPGNKLTACLVNHRSRSVDFHLYGIIAVSAYLKEYYRNHHVKTIWIPPLMPVLPDFEIQKYEYYQGKNVINIIYAGFPGNKDILIPFVRAVQEVNKKEIKVRFDIIGIDKNYFEVMGYNSAIDEDTGIYLHGVLDREETLTYVKRADFGMLLRHDKPYAKAGFSTKFAECMSVGVAMICNQVGGTDTIVKAWINGIVTEGTKEKELTSVLYKLTKMSPEEILKIRRSAYEDAKLLFSGDCYTERFKEFMGESLE